ncbi:MAG TPA: transposase [Gaiellaceae bacterium]|nr:transposase [Gaiellaceae bacterium]
MLYAGLDLSRKRLDFHLLGESGACLEVGATPPDRDGLRGLARRVDRHGQPVRAAIESMNGARFVHDQFELAGWEVEIADAQKVKGLAPLACKTDRIDAWVLAELCRRELVPAIWLPDPEVRAEREPGTLAPAPRPPPLELEAARPCRPARAWPALPRLRPLRQRRPPAARAASTARAVGR